MKKCIFILTVTLLFAAVLLTGCSTKHREQEAEKLAKKYLDELKDQVSDETLYLTNDDAEHYGEMIAFIAYSEKCDGDFRIYVNTDDSVSDSYFAVSLKDTASYEFAELLESIFPDESPEFELSVMSVMGLSGKVFTSVKEAHKALDNTIGLISVVITPFDSSKISDKILDELLKSMQSEAFYGDLCISDDVRVFHISETEINYTRTDDGPGKVRYYQWIPGQNE